MSFPSAYGGGIHPDWGQTLSGGADSEPCEDICHHLKQLLRHAVFASTMLVPILQRFSFTTPLKLPKLSFIAGYCGL